MWDQMLCQFALFQAIFTHGSHAIRVAVSQNKDNVESSKHISLHSKIFPTLYTANDSVFFTNIFVLFYSLHSLDVYLFMYMTCSFQYIIWGRNEEITQHRKFN